VLAQKPKHQIMNPVPEDHHCREEKQAIEPVLLRKKMKVHYTSLKLKLH
jgi:hypothetical protein